MGTIANIVTLLSQGHQTTLSNLIADFGSYVTNVTVLDLNSPKNFGGFSGYSINRKSVLINFFKNILIYALKELSKMTDNNTSIDIS